MDPLYYPLSHNQNIRLLHIGPGIFPDPMRCVLEEVSPESQPEYEGLSYTWGPPQPARNLCFGDVEKPVGPNLYDAIQRLRYPYATRTLWVDAICINQDDSNEKTHQIRLMGKIYQEAQRVQIWLGNADEYTYQAFALLHKLHNYFDSLVCDINLAVVLDDYRKLQDARRQVQRTFTDDLRSASQWASLTALLRRPWFTRIWVIQETVYARQATFICGPQEFPWNDLKTVVISIGSLNLLHHLTENGTEGLTTNIIQMVNKMRLSPDSHAYPGIYEIITLTRETQATDPRDKIFALLGLIRRADDRNQLVNPDYNISVVEVYTDVVIRFLRRPDFFRVMQLISDSPPIKPVSGLPSWVPDFSQNTTRQPFEAGIYQAGDRATSLPVISIDHKKLSIFVRILHGVQDLAPPYYELIESMPRKSREVGLRPGIYAMAMFYQGCSELVSGLRWANSSFSRRHVFKEAYWRALICNCDVAAKKPSAIYETHFDTFHRIWSRPLGQLSTELPTTHDIECSAPFETAFMRWSSARRFCVTTSGTMAWAPQTSIKGDLICVMEGAEIPFVIRRIDNERYGLIGECYAHGFMYGEASLQAGAFPIINITLR